MLKTILDKIEIGIIRILKTRYTKLAENIMKQSFMKGCFGRIFTVNS